jgi:hypothetical protein
MHNNRLCTTTTTATTTTTTAAAAAHTNTYVKAFVRKYSHFASKFVELLSVLQKLL